MTGVRKHVSQARAQKSRNVACEQALCLRKGWKKKLNLPLPSPRDFFTLSPNREPVYMLVETQQILLFSSEECAAGKQESKSTFKLWPKILITLYRIPEYVLYKYAMRIFCWFPNILDQWEPRGNFPSTWAFSHAWVPSDKIKSKQQSRTPSVALNFDEDCVPLILLTI